MIELKKDSFEFHNTFQPQRVYLAQILKLAANGYEGTKEEISDITGIPTGKSSGKVVPHIKYANYMGLINYSLCRQKYKLGITELGKEVYKQDPMLTSKVTHLLCHYNMCDDIQGAPQWTYLFKYFKSNNIQCVNVDILMEIAYKEIGKNVDFSIINKIYSSNIIEDNILGRILLKVNKGQYDFKQVEYSFEEIYVYAYSLLDSWEKYSNDSNQITIDTLMENIKWGNIFGLSRDSVVDILDELQDFGVVEVNKQMVPIVIQRLDNSKNIVDKLYDFCG